MQTKEVQKSVAAVTELLTTEKTGKLYDVDIRNVDELNKIGGNVRVDYGETDGSLVELMHSILINGIKMPMRAYRNREVEGKWFAIDGHRRRFAAMKLVNMTPDELETTCIKAGMTKENAIFIRESKIKGTFEIRTRVVLVNADTVKDEDLIVDMVVTNTGKALSPLELSEAVKRMLALVDEKGEKKFKVKDVASRFGMNVGAVKNFEMLATAPKRIRDLIAANKVKYTVALEFLKQSADFNEAVEKIEEALGHAVAKKASASAYNDDSVTQTELSDNKDFEDVRITRAELNKSMNKNDSMIELRKVFKKQIDFPSEIANPELHSFAKKLMENRLTASDIDKLLFIQQ